MDPQIHKSCTHLLAIHIEFFTKSSERQIESVYRLKTTYYINNALEDIRITGNLDSGALRLDEDIHITGNLDSTALRLDDTQAISMSRIEEGICPIITTNVEYIFGFPW